MSIHTRKLSLPTQKKDMTLRAIFLFLLLLLPCFISNANLITTTQPLKINDRLLSKEKNFELYFFNPKHSSNWYAGIRYAKLLEKSIVWVANRNNPVNETSTAFLIINQLGNLALYPHNNTNISIWSTNISVQNSTDPSTISAQLLDSGNLVLMNKETMLWQSFDYPTDTFLPGMKVGMNRQTGQKWSISSWNSESDPGTGEYSFQIDLSGAPQFYLYKGSAKIWRGSPFPWTKRLSMLSVYPANYNYVDNEKEIYYIISPEDPAKTIRHSLDISGVLRILMLDEGGRQWEPYWVVPIQQCDWYAECGANAKCSPDKYSGFGCECLPGFEPRVESEWRQRNASSGCVRTRRRNPAECADGDGFETVERLNLPDTSNAVLRWVGNPAECEEMCAQNCQCSAFMINGADGDKKGCFMWFGDLVDIVMFADDGVDLIVRVDTTQKIANNSIRSKSFLRKNHVAAVAIICVVLSLLFGLGFLLFCLKRKRKSTNYENEERRNEPDLQAFDLSTIMAATQNFASENKLGQGGFGSVHEGLLSDGQKIAVKRLSMSSGQGLEEFKNEIALIAKLQHRNLVKLLGYCVDGEEKMLIYEYMPNKSLDSFIFDQTRRSCLNWKMRFDIIVGVARGILYLHQDSRLRIIHRDLKASNVLLDSDLNPKISDFGMARTLTGDQIQDKTNRVVGTYGYMSPEYAVFGKFSTKSDVFSFGVIMLEIISGMRNNKCCQQDKSINLIGYVWRLWKEDRALEAVDSLLESYIPNEALRCIQIGLLCVQEEVKDRPTMSLVVLMLNSEIALPPPNKPAYMFTKSLEDTDSRIGEPKLCSINHLTISKVIAR